MGLSMRTKIYLLFVFLMIGFLVAGCSLLGDVPLPEVLGTPTPEPSPTPLGSTLDFSITDGVYAVSLAPGESVPGTPLTFIDKADDTIYAVSIAGKEAALQDGNSFNWQGIIGPGVTGDYRLNLLPTFNETALKANGNVFVTIFEPTPKEGAAPQLTDKTLLFDNMLVDYVVPVSRTIPGTTLIYQSVANNVVTFSGTQGLPNYTIGDSVLWTGFVRDNIYLQSNLTLKSVETNGLHVTGSATLWVFPAAVTGSP